MEFKYPDDALDNFPKPGDKLIFRGVNSFWFTDIIKNAIDNLIIGNIYTISEIEVYSSWAMVRVEETGDVEYALAFFERI